MWDAKTVTIGEVGHAPADVPDCAKLTAGEGASGPGNTNKKVALHDSLRAAFPTLNIQHYWTDELHIFTGKVIATLLGRKFKVGEYVTIVFNESRIERPNKIKEYFVEASGLDGAFRLERGKVVLKMGISSDELKQRYVVAADFMREHFGAGSSGEGEASTESNIDPQGNLRSTVSTMAVPELAQLLSLITSQVFKAATVNHVIVGVAGTECANVAVIVERVADLIAESPGFAHAIANTTKDKFRSKGLRSIVVLVLTDHGDEDQPGVVVDLEAALARIKANLQLGEADVGDGAPLFRLVVRSYSGALPPPETRGTFVMTCDGAQHPVKPDGDIDPVRCAGGVIRLGYVGRRANPGYTAFREGEATGRVLKDLFSQCWHPTKPAELDAELFLR